MPRSRFTKTVLLILIFAGLFTAPSILEACPNCKSSVAHNGNGMALGFAWSIGFMLAVPTTIISAWIIALRKHLRLLDANHHQA